MCAYRAILCYILIYQLRKKNNNLQNIIKLSIQITDSFKLQILQSLNLQPIHFL